MLWCKSDKKTYETLYSTKFQKSNSQALMNFKQQLKKFRLEKYLEISATKLTDSMPHHLQGVKGGHTKHEIQTSFKYVQRC